MANLDRSLHSYCFSSMGSNGQRAYSNTMIKLFFTCYIFVLLCINEAFMVLLYARLLHDLVYLYDIAENVSAINYGIIFCRVLAVLYVIC